MAKNESQEVARQDQDSPKAGKRPETWEERLDRGKKLSPLQEVQADADFNHKKRVKDEEERQEYEARKAAYAGDKRSSED